MSSHLLLLRRRAADGHERAVPGQVGLFDEDVGHARDLQAVPDRAERGLIGYREDDGVGAGREPSRARLAGGVDQLRCEYSQREVSANDAVVGQGRGGEKRYVSRFSVATRRSCGGVCDQKTACQDSGG